MKAFSRRDLTIIEDGEKLLVIACDSCGGIGEKRGDVLRLSPYYVGKLTARVALTEVMCSGAAPITLVNGASCEMNPSGAEMIRGIRDELSVANLENTILTGSTEENFTTSMTATAITVIGSVDKAGVKFSSASPGDKIVLFGTPKVGAEVDLQGEGFYREISVLLSLQGVREIVPVGSKGIAYEAETLAALSGLSFSPYNTDDELYKSAGPVTCMIALCDEAAVSALENPKMIGELK